MTTSAAMQARLAVEQLVAHAAELTGFSVDAIARPMLQRMIARERAKGVTVLELIGSVTAGVPAALAALRRAVTVGETFFFRQPEHFHWIADDFMPGWAARSGGTLRAWSAGCATGEEAYSLAATLVAGVRPGSSVEVDLLGTDPVDHAIAHAVAATYGPSARRPSCPILHPVLEPIGDELSRVLPRITAVTRFAVHDLREPPPGQFDLVVCRNVLVYFSPQTQATALATLVAAVAPGGRLLLGPMDVDGVPPQMERIGPPELQIFRRRDDAPVRAQTRPGLPRSSSQAERPRPPQDPVEIHERALIAIENGESRIAERMLAELNRTFPTYLPGIVERALLHSRNGERTAAIEWMRECLRRAEHLGSADLFPGPEGLPVRFYVASASAFLRSQGERE
jgi:chemotaxis protein methyltransferase CheR